MQGGLVWKQVWAFALLLARCRGGSVTETSAGYTSKLREVTLLGHVKLVMVVRCCKGAKAEL